MMRHNLRIVDKTRVACGVIVAAALAAGCTRQSNQSAATQAVAVKSAAKQEPQPSPAAQAESKANAFVGSKTCYDCHAKFYDLWSTSRHGLAMQPYSPAFAQKELKPQAS